MPDRTPPSATVREIAAQGGIAVDETTAERIWRSVAGVASAAGDYQDALALDDAPNDIARLRAELQEDRT